MLFWAGLRGAVGVALAAGFKGENANALRTTVLVVVVLTVILFGGTTARMLEVMGIRVGVEDEDGDSDAEDDNKLDAYDAWSAPTKSKWKRRSQRLGQEDYSDLWNADMPMDRYNQPSSSQSRGGPNLPSSSRTSESSDAEEFTALRPASAPPTGALTPGLGVGGVVPTFESLDQRYLLPLFSNPVASRNFHARKAAYRRSMLNLSLGERDIGEGGDDGEPGEDRGTSEPIRDLRGAGGSGTSTARSGGRLSVPGTPRSSSPRFGATRPLPGSGTASGVVSPAAQEGGDDRGNTNGSGSARRRDSVM